MNIDELIERLREMKEAGRSGDTPVKAWDADAGAYVEITGLLILSDAIEIQTDEL